VIVGASATVQAPVTSPLQLTVERITVESEAGLGLGFVNGPLAFIVEAGTATFIDDLGLEAPYGVDDARILPAGSVTELRNFDAVDATVLLFYLGGSGVVETADEASPAAVGEPVQRETLVTGDGPFVGVEATMFLGVTSWEPGADLGSHLATGPVALYVEEGELAISRSTGVESLLREGRGVVLPGELERRERNTGEDAITVVMAGLVSTEGLVQAPPTATPEATETPTITPTPEPTETLEPTATAEPTDVPTSTPIPTATDVPPPTETPEPTSTSEPTSTPEPTATETPEPTATPKPEPGSVLYEASDEVGFEGWGGGNGWKQLDGMLINDGGTDGVSYAPAPFTVKGMDDYAIEAEIQLVRGIPSDCNIGFGIQIRESNEGLYQSAIYKQCGFDSSAYAIIAGPPEYFHERLAEQEFNPGSDWHTYRFEGEGDELRLYIDGGLVLRTKDNRYLEGGDFSLLSIGLQLSVRRVRVIVLGGDISSSNDVATDELAVVGDGDLEASRSQIAAMLPDENEVPSGLVVVDEQRRTLDILTQNYSNQDEALGYFTELGWQGNVTRTFGPPGGVIISAGMTSSVYVSIHRFGDADGARQALDYSFDDLTSAIDGADIEEGGFGDYSRTIRESNDDGNSVAIHVQVGTVFFRVSAVSVDGDPYGDAVDVMNVVLGKI